MASNPKKLYSTVLVEDGTEKRTRRARERAARQVVARDHATQRQQAQERAHAERTEARSALYLPPGGESGKAALRSYRPFRVPAHQDTSAALRGAYPFVAEGGLGSQGVFVGQDMYSGGSFVYDPWRLYQRGIITAPNLVLAGIVGFGKSSLAKSLNTRSIPFGRRVYVPGDPKGEHTPVAEAVGGKAIVLGHGLRNRLNPLDEGYRPAGLSDAEWASTVAARRRDLIGALAETVLERALSPLEHTVTDIALQAVVSTASVPMFRKSAERANDQFRKGDNFIAEGETRTYTGQDGAEREQFVASRIGHDNNITRYSVDRTPPQRDAAERDTPARETPDREPASRETAQLAVTAREAALEPDPEPSASTTSVQREAVTR